MRFRPSDSTPPIVFERPELLIRGLIRAAERVGHFASAGRPDLDDVHATLAKIGVIA